MYSFLSRLVALGVIALACLSPFAWSTDLPPGLTNYLKSQDPEVKIRFDGLIFFSNGESYIPVFPQGIDVNPDPVEVVQRSPNTGAYPDILRFDNNLFLLRMIPTSTGKLTLPRRADYPIELKEGLLPQDLILPKNLSIPAELRVILGSLPYDLPEALPADLKPIEAVQSSFQGKKNLESTQSLFVADLNQQRILALNPQSGQELWHLSLDCLPSAIALQKDGKQLYTSCLNTDEILVIDTQAQLVKNRIPSSAKPSSLALVPSLDLLLSASRFDAILSYTDTKRNLKIAELELPGRGGAMAIRPQPEVAYIADAYKNRIYEVDLENQRLLRELGKNTQEKLLRQISTLYFQPSEKGLGYLWLASRLSNQVQVIDLLSERIIYETEVGEKPLSFAEGADGLLYLLCADGDRIEVFDKSKEPLRLEPIVLSANSFPASFNIDPEGRYAYVASAGDEELYVIDLRTRMLRKAIPLEARGIAMSLFDSQHQAKASFDSKALKQELDALTPSVQKQSKEKKLDQSGNWQALDAKPIHAENIPGESLHIETEPAIKDETPTPEETIAPASHPDGPKRRWGWWPFGRRGQ